MRCVVLKAVTDHAGEGDRETLRRNLEQVSDRLAEVVCEGLFRLAPPRRGLVRRLLDLVKVEHSAFSLPLLFAGAWLGAGCAVPPLHTVGLVIVAGVAARALGMVVNRLMDRDVDALNRRTRSRELAAGTMTPRAALGLAGVALVVYVAACAGLGGLCLVLSPIPAALLIGYSLLKRVTVLCHFGIGACMALAPLGAHVAVRGDLWVSPEILLLAVFAFCWISGFDIIYALQDMEADRQTGICSLPARLGAAGAQGVAALVHVLAGAALVGVWGLQGFSVAGGVLAAVSVGAMGAAYVPWIPLPVRFFPVSAIAGVAGAFVPMLGGGR